MKIVVSGGAGFIGSHLCEKLLAQDNEVICIDNLITGNHNNIKKLEGNKRFQFLLHDITLPFVEDLSGIDHIYNLASPASPKDYLIMPLQTLWTNAAGTKQLLELAQKNGAAFLQASTSEIYGDPLVHPQDETYFGNVNPIGERSCYDEGKRFAESLAMNYYRHYRMPMKIARIFNTYGPRMRKSDGRVIPNFIDAAIHDEPLKIYGDGQQTRSFCYVDDLVRGLIDAMNCKDLIGPVNLGNDTELTVLELAKKIIALCGSQSMITHIALPSDDPRQRRPDLNLAKKKINFTPEIMIDLGLQKTIDFFRSLG